MTLLLSGPREVSTVMRVRARTATLALACLVPGFLLFSCAHEQKPPLRERLLLHMSSPPEKEAPPEPLAPEAGASGERAEAPGVDAARLRELEPLKYQGAPEVAKPSQPELPFSKSKRVTVALDEMPLSDFVNAVFSDILGVNYVVDPKVKGQKDPVTLNLDQAMTEYQVFQAVVEVLRRYRVSVHFKGGVFYVLSEASTAGIALGIGSSVNDIPAAVGQILQIIPVRYTDVQNVKAFLPQIGDATLTMFAEENILAVKGTRDQVEQVIQMVNALDRPVMRGRFVGMVRLKYWRPVEMAEKLREVLTQEGIPVTLEPGRKGVYINKLDRWAALLLFAAEKQWLDRARDWIDLLDVPVEKEERQFFLFFPENSKAVELGVSLEKILGLGILETPSARPGAGSRGARAGTTSGAAPPAAGAPVPVRMQAGSEQEPATVRTAPSREAPGAAADLRIAVDESRNALIIFATPERYRPLEALLKKLDVTPAQVLLECTIAEVTLTGSLQFGIEWFLRFNIGDFRTAVSTVGGLALGSGGLNLSVIHDNQKFRLFLNALAEEQLLKIRSSPRLTVRDGKSASITVGTEVPVITSEGTTPDVSAGIVRAVQYRSTGVTLRVTPTIHAQRIVTLEIYQEVSEAQTNPTSTIDSPIIRNSTVTTEVVAANGQTVLLGGLIQENESKTVTKVPLLGDIPLVGPLFRSTSKSSNRSELVVILTPQIIRTPGQMDELRDAVLDSLRNLGRDEN